MLHISKQERIEQLEGRYRAALINGLSGIKNASLIATKSKEGVSNVTIFTSLFHLGADPALMGIIFRPVPGHTLKNILDTEKFTINHLPADFSKSLHQTSARYEGSEFSKCGFKEEYLDGWDAPFVKEAAIKWSMSFVRVIDIPENGTHMMIAAVEDIYFADDFYLREDGSLDTSEHLCGVIGLDSYHRIEKGVRYSYAKADRDSNIL